MACACCGDNSARWLCNDDCGSPLCDECIRHFAWPDTGQLDTDAAIVLGFTLIDEATR